MIHKTERIPFDVIREEWSEYELSNGVILRLKQPLVELTPLEKNPEPTKEKISVNVSFSDIIFSILDNEKGPLGKGDQYVIKPSDIIEKLKFKQIKIPLNMYEIPTRDKILLMRLKLESIDKTKLFNTQGKRVYNFITKSEVGVLDTIPTNLKTV